METVQSVDGTTIAFDRLGAGPPIVLVCGASVDRHVSDGYAAGFAEHFTVLNHDRRGRGDSTDTAPYSVVREIEDVRAVLTAAGGPAALLGFSSGAALAALAVAEGAPVAALVLWEPPYAVSDEDAAHAKAYAATLASLLGALDRDGALAHFMRYVGMPPEAIEQARSSPYWAAGLALAPTLAYDAAVLGDGRPPADRLAAVGAPTLVLAGDRSPQRLRDAALAAAAAIPGARSEVLAGQDHAVTPEALVPVVAEFVEQFLAGT